MSYAGFVSVLPAAVPRHTRCLGLRLVLALLLLLAQTGLILHELEHQSAAPDAYCALCLFAQHLGDALDSAIPPTVCSSSLSPLVDTDGPQAPTECIAAFSARAPPAQA